jgi:hypothetical protein
MRRSRFIVLAPAVLLLGCAKEHFDSRSKAILAGATKVEVFRLDPEDSPYRFDKPRVDGEKRIGGWLITAQGKDQGKEFAVKLAALLDEKHDKSGGAKCFDPGVAFRVWKDDEYADVLICYHCNNYYFGPPTQRAKENAGITTLRPLFVQLAKEAFPEDKEIQALKEEYHEMKQ